MFSNATHHSQSSVSQSLTSSIVAFTLVSSLGRLIRHLGWNIYVGSTVSNLIFVLSCCSTQRKFSINPSVDTNLSSVCETGKELFKIMTAQKLAQLYKKGAQTFILLGERTYTYRHLRHSLSRCCLWCGNRLRSISYILSLNRHNSPR